MPAGLRTSLRESELLLPLGAATTVTPAGLDLG